MNQYLSSELLPLNEAAICEGFWTFGLADGGLFARNLVLLANGRVMHYHSPNERRWRIEGCELLLMTEDGIPSARLRQVATQVPGRIRLEGEHIVGGPSGIILALQETGLIYPVYLHWTKAMDDFIASVPIYLTTPYRTNGVYTNGQLVCIQKQALIEPHASLPYNSFLSVGAYTYCHGTFHSGTATIGRYCSIAAGARPFGPSHPMERVSSALFSYDPYYVEIAKQFGVSDYAVEPYNQEADQVHIGHDVWIGEDVMIKGGVSIGIGCVLAARSVVTKDVPDYSIVVGTPGRVLRQRFAPDIVEGLLASRWWTYNFCDLPRLTSQPGHFIEVLGRQVAAGLIQAWEPMKIDIAQELLRLND